MPLQIRPTFARRYHRHYHRRLRYLHHRRPPPPRLDTPPSLVSVGLAWVRSSSSSLWSGFCSLPDHVSRLHRHYVLWRYPVTSSIDEQSGVFSVPLSAETWGLADPVGLSRGDRVLVDIFVDSFDPSDPCLWSAVSGFGSFSPRRVCPISDEVLDKFCRRLDPVKLFHASTLFDGSSSQVSSLPLDDLKGLYSAILSSSSAFLASGGDSLPIVIDTGASTSLTPRREDFISFHPEDSAIEGIGSSSAIKGRGIVRWKIRDQHGVDAVIETTAVYVPDAPIRLYSPQFHFREKMCGVLSMTHTELILKVPDSTIGDNVLVELSFPFHSQSNLPLMLKQDHPSFLKSLFNSDDPVQALTCVDSIRRIPIVEDVETTVEDDSLAAFLLDCSNSNLSMAQKELLVWHWKLGHVDMKKIQRIMRPRSDPVTDEGAVDHLIHPTCIETKQSKTNSCTIPLCQACVQGKQTRRPTNASRHVSNPDVEGALSKGHCDPGSKVSLDQYVVGTKGRLYTSFGHEKSSDRFSGGTIFRDHGSGFIFVHHQVSLRAGETVIGKRLFEREAASVGVSVKSYHSDNGVFASEEFRSHCDLHKQPLSFSGVGSQHQNGCAERAIRTVFSLARALLIHSAIHWPDAYDLCLWPMAVDYATWVVNNLPGDDGLSPLEKFSQQRVENYNHLRRAHVWGAPCYVLEPTLLRRSSRLRQRNSRIYNDSFETGFYSLTHAESNSKRRFTRGNLDDFDIGRLNWDASMALLAGTDGIINGDSQRFFAAMEHLEDPLSHELDSLPPLALFNKAAAADNPRYHEAMSGPNREGFLDASVIEISTLQSIGAWTQVPRTSSMNILPSTWAFKVKRFPDGLVRKLKARFCVRGDKQIEGVDFHDTYAPVVQWSTVRLMLILSLSLGLVTTQVDYIAAFCQAPIDEDVHIELPLGWQNLNGLGILEKFKPGHVLKLNRSVYGLRQSPKNFFHHLKGNLEKCGFRQSTLDPCLFYSDDVICVTYVDDCLFFAKDKSSIDASIAAIKRTGMDLQVEDDVAGFLGVHITREKDSDENGDEIEKITLLQTGLIDRIISALGLNDSATGVQTPAIAAPLTKDIGGEPFDQSFNYASVVGMMMYLCNNSRPDITFAVSQCARFTHSPTMLQATYLKRIGRYLLRTRSKGLTMIRSASLELDCYVDADFCGLFNHEDLQDPSSVKSRTGFVITVGKCPVVWSSKLQGEITLSTMEAEYVACSAACRELFPIRSLVIEIAANLKLQNTPTPIVHTTIWEDNSGALALANMELPRTTPHSRHFSVKYHWFRSLLHSTDPDRCIRIKKIGTLEQLGDLFTKGLGFSLFKDLRLKLMGW